MQWRKYDPERDREAARQILRALLGAGSTSCSIHPGDWDWWIFHREDGAVITDLIAEGAVAEVVHRDRLIAAFGCSADDAVDIAQRTLGPGPLTAVEISARDNARIEQLEARGFRRRGTPAPVFERPTAGADAVRVPNGFSIAPLGGEDRHAERAAAARRAFNTSMTPDAHAARYLRFMRSPGYVADNDLVATAPDGRVAAFTIFWPDRELSLTQLEPVGTDPDFQRIGLARALISEALRRSAAQGVTIARVMTNGDNHNAIACYESCGFVQVDTLEEWYADAPFNR